MTFEMLKGKIHRATVVQAELDYVGSITVDEDLLDSAGILGSPPTADHGKFGTNMSDWRWLETIYEGHRI